MKVDLSIPHLLDYLIVILATTFCLVDSLNGWMLHNGISLPLTLSQLYKFPLILLILFRLSISGGKSMMYAILGLCGIIAFFWIHHLMASFSSPMEDLAINLKILLFFLSFLYFEEMATMRPAFFRRWFKRILVGNFAVMAGNIFLGALGFGYAQYYGNIGSVGYFYAGNEVSALLLFVATFILGGLWKRGWFWYLIGSITLFLLAVSAATKVAMLGMVVLFLGIPILSERSKLWQLNQFKLRLLFISGIGVVLLVVFLPGLLEDVGLMNRWRFWYKKYDNDLVTLLLSGRNIAFTQSLKALHYHYEPFSYLFGKGYSAFVDYLSNYTIHNISVESDPVDVFYSYGLVGFFSLYLFYFWQFVRSMKAFREPKHIFAPFAMLFIAVIVAVGGISGHVIFSGMGALFYGLAFASISYQSNQDEDVG
jgi:hypothetical protein